MTGEQQQRKSTPCYTYPKTRKSKFAPEEIGVLVRHMRKYAKQLQGRWANKKQLQRRQKVWLEVVDAVNAVGVEERTVDEVKTKWKKCRKTYEVDVVKSEDECE